MNIKIWFSKAGLALFVILTMLFAFGVSAFANTGSFADAVAGFNKNATYADRLAAYNSATELYEALTPEEIALLSEVISLYEVEGEELNALKERAVRFINAVNSLADMPDLDDKILIIEHVKSLDNYIDDKTIEGIEDALKTLEAAEKKILEVREACDAFIGYADVLSTADEEDYLTIRMALDGAEACQSKIDLTYDGVVEARSIILNLKTLITKRETYTKEFIHMTGEALKQESYKDKKEYYDYAIDYVDGEDYLPDYPGAREAELSLAELAEQLKEDIAAANVFVSAVTRIGSGEGIAKDIIGALRILKGIDKTAPGVDSAVRILDEAKESYNETIEKINADFSAL